VEESIYDFCLFQRKSEFDFIHSPVTKAFNQIALTRRNLTGLLAQKLLFLPARRSVATLVF